MQRECIRNRKNEQWLTLLTHKFLYYMDFVELYFRLTYQGENCHCFVKFSKID
jgi:hypothetical protein